MIVKIDSLNAETYRLIKRLLKYRIIEDKHWRWNGSKVDGYGRLTFRGYSYKIHRLIAYLCLGLKLNDDTILICHKISCPYRDCWNPLHIYLGNEQTNMQDASRLGTDTLGRKTSKTHCNKEHELIKENIGYDRGYPYCKICKEITRKKSFKMAYERYLKREESRNDRSN